MSDWEVKSVSKIGDTISIILTPAPSISAGAGAFLFLMIFQILHYPDLNIWLMLAISAFCGFILTTPSAIFILGWLVWAIWTVYNP